MASMVLIVVALWAVHRHYAAIRVQLRRRTAPAKDPGQNHVILLVPDAGVATAEALGFVRSFRPRDLRALYVPLDGSDPYISRRWDELSGGRPALEGLNGGGDGVPEALKAYLRDIPRASHDYVTVVIPEVIEDPGLPYLIKRRDLIRLKGSLLREPGVVVVDVPVLMEGGLPVGVDGRPLVPQRTVALLFVSRVDDATVRAVNYTRSLHARETRAVFFAFDPKEAPPMQEQWADCRFDLPLDLVEAPFRDLRTPMLDEVRRYTAHPDTVVAVVMPEFVVRRWRHLLLHNQTALFVKRLLLFEPQVILASVPYVLE
jgi:hypothetical protein